MKRFNLYLLILNVVISATVLSQSKKTYFNRFFDNWEYDSSKNIYILQDYPLGMKILDPCICSISFDITKKLFQINGKVLYPKFNKKGYELVGHVKITYAFPSNNNQAKFVSELGFSDSIGNFSFTLPNPPSKFYLLFSKGELLPSAVEFNLPKPRKRENWTSIAALCSFNYFD